MNFKRTLPRFGFIAVFLLAGNAQGYWLMAANNVLTTQRIDPIMNPGTVSTHVHAILGGSNFGLSTTAASLRASECTSIPIREDKSNYWYPQLYFQWSNGTFTSVTGNPVIQDYLFSDATGATAPFPDDVLFACYLVRISTIWRELLYNDFLGDYTLRTFDPSSFAQQAITFLCLDFKGTSARFNELPRRRCPAGIRSQINFPSCWDGVNTDSPDHRSHVAFLSTGPDNGTCSDPGFPMTIPRIFLEVYWYTQAFDDFRRQAKVPDQPFVFSNGDPVGYSYHADFINGWDSGVLERAINECNCNPYGDPSCCAAKGTFTMDQTTRCYISDTVNEPTLGTLDSLPGNNPVQARCYEEFFDSITPAMLSPVFVSNSTDMPPPSGTIAVHAQTATTPQLAKGTCIGNGAVHHVPREMQEVLLLVLLSSTLLLG